MKPQHLTPYAVIAILVVLLLRQCGKDVPNSTTTSDTVVTYDTITRTVQGKPRIVEQWRTDTILDTVQVVRDYATAKVYIDSVVSDTLAIYVQDTLQYNAIQGRSIGYTLRLPTKTITNTTTIRKPVSGLYLGAFGTQSSVGIGATYVAPRWLGSVGIGTQGMQAGVAFKVLPRSKR